MNFFKNEPCLRFVVMNQESLLAQFEMLIPAAAAWATEQEQKILRESLPLLEPELADAHAMGVHNPDRVRLLQVETIPRPSQAQLKSACDAIDFGVRNFIRSDCWRDRSLIVHELVHIAQYERFGGILPFLRSYLFECLTVGYSAAPLEQEAIAIAARVCASSGS